MNFIQRLQYAKSLGLVGGTVREVTVDVGEGVSAQVYAYCFPSGEQMAISCSTEVKYLEMVDPYSLSEFQHVAQGDCGWVN